MKPPVVAPLRPKVPGWVWALAALPLLCCLGIFLPDPKGTGDDGGLAEGYVFADLPRLLNDPDGHVVRARREPMGGQTWRVEGDYEGGDDRPYAYSVEVTVGPKEGPEREYRTNGLRLVPSR